MMSEVRRGCQSVAARLGGVSRAAVRDMNAQVPVWLALVLVMVGAFGSVAVADVTSRRVGASAVAAPARRQDPAAVAERVTTDTGRLMENMTAGPVGLDPAVILRAAGCPRPVIDQARKSLLAFCGYSRSAAVVVVWRRLGLEVGAVTDFQAQGQDDNSPGFGYRALVAGPLWTIKCINPVECEGMQKRVGGVVVVRP